MRKLDILCNQYLTIISHKFGCLIFIHAKTCIYKNIQLYSQKLKKISYSRLFFNWTSFYSDIFLLRIPKNLISAFLFRIIIFVNDCFYFLGLLNKLFEQFELFSWKVQTVQTSFRCKMSYFIYSYEWITLNYIGLKSPKSYNVRTSKFSRARFLTIKIFH